jgi:hypothetical protein
MEAPAAGGDSPAPPISNSYWVEPGRLLAGRHPAGGARGTTKATLRRLLEAGITCFMDLTEPREGGWEPYEPLLRAEADGLGMTVSYRRLPVPDYGVPSRTDMHAIQGMLAGALAAGQGVFVHCWGGIGRTGTVIGCYLVEHGFTGRTALATIARLRSELPSSYWPSPESQEQVDMVLGWQREAGAPARRLRRAIRRRILTGVT